MGMRRNVCLLATGFILLLDGAPCHADYFVTDVVDAAKRGDIHAVHQLIQESPEVVSAKDDSGFTALHWAGVRGHWRIFSELLAADAPVNAVGGDGGTPLHWACHHDNPEMIGRLIEAGADIHVENRWGRTPLHVAARRGCAGVVELLLGSDADPTAQTREGWTPLHVASMSGQPAVAALLVEGGADPEARDNEGLTPAEVARQRPPSIDLPTSSLEQYVGIYDLGGGFNTKVWQEGEKLMIREFAPDGLRPIGPDTFFCEQEPWRITFLRGDDNEIESIELQFLRRAVRGTRTPSPRYVGATACASCHAERKNGSPHISWMQSRHGHAYWRLGADWALFLAKLRPHYQDLESPIEDFRCLLCHVTGLQDDDALFASSYRPEEGVSCEACHGPGSLYMDPEVMADREAFLAAGGQVPDESTCRGCHRKSENFDFEEKWAKVVHGGSEE